MADPTVSINQSTKIIEAFKQKINNEADIIFGFDVDQNLKNEIQIAIIATKNKDENNQKEQINTQLNEQILDINDEQLHETLIKIGNTLELELSGKQPIVNENFLEADDLGFLNEDQEDENIFIEVDENDDDIPFFLK